MRNPYDVLGISPRADSKAIKQAFRQLAIRFHPDHNHDPNAARYFREVNWAYEMLCGASQSRDAWARQKSTAKKPRPQPHSSDFFSQMDLASLNMLAAPAIARQRRMARIVSFSLLTSVGLLFIFALLTSC